MYEFLIEKKKSQNSLSKKFSLSFEDLSVLGMDTPMSGFRTQAYDGAANISGHISEV